MQQKSYSFDLDSKHIPQDHHNHQVVETSKVTKIKDEQGRSKINNYTIHEKLGEGSFGKVKLAVKDGTGEKFAVKIFKKSLLKRRREAFRDSDGKMKYKDALEDVMREIAIMKKLAHENVVTLNEVIEHPQNDKIYMVIDLAEGGQIIDWDEDQCIFINKSKEGAFSEKELRSIFRQLVIGLDYLHHNGIVHRDLKPQNILHDGKGIVKIADLGVSSLVGDDDTLTNTQGTYHFMPPETVGIDGAKGYHGKAADIWALGVTFFAFTYFKVPYVSDNVMDLLDMIRDQPVEYPTEPEVSAGLLNLIKKILEKDPLKRASIDDIKKDEWLNQGEISLHDIKHEEPISVTHEEISRAFHTLETVVLSKKFIKKLRHRVSLHSVASHELEHKISSFARSSASGSNISDETASTSNEGKLVQDQEEEKSSIPIIEQKIQIKESESLHEISEKAENMTIENPQEF